MRCNDGAVHVEVPPFGPGAGSAASAGMTEVWAGMAEVGERGWRGRVAADQADSFTAVDVGWTLDGN